MLRMLFASALVLFGARHAVRGPFYALLFYLFIAYFRPDTWVWTSTIRDLNLSFGVAIFLLAYAAVSSERIAFTLASAVILAFAIHGLVSTLMSPYEAWCFLWWKRFARVAVIAVMIIALVNTTERLRLTFVVIALSLAFEGAKQGWAFLILGTEEANLNALEILGDNNGVALGMLMLSAVLIALIQTTNRRWEQALFAFLLVGSLFRSFTTHSRGGLLTFAAMCIMYWWYSSHRIRNGVLIAAFVAVLSVVLPQQYWNRMDTIQLNPDGTDVSAVSRLHFWQVARRMADAHPFLGVGTVGFEAAYNDYDNSNGAFGKRRAVHSTWYGVLADQGYVGLAMLSGLLICAFWVSGTRGIPDNAPDRAQLVAYSNALRTALVCVAVGGTFLSYHYVEILWHFVALGFAFGLVRARVTAECAALVPVAPTVQRQFQLAH